MRLARLSLRSLLLVVLFSATCAPTALQTQARLANSIGLAGNRTLPVLIETYRADGLRVISEARAAGLPREEAERRLQVHVMSWRPVWGVCDEHTGLCVNGAWPALRATHEAWSAALEAQIAGAPLDVAAATAHATRMHAAFCALRGAVPLPARDSIPQIPGAECPNPTVTR